MKEMLSNKILTGLSDAEFARLMPWLEPISLAAGERLAEYGEAARFVYFPENCVISCQADMQDGKSTEVGMVGKEGVAGLPSLLSSRPMAHSLNITVAGSAIRLKRVEFERELHRGEGLCQGLLGYAGEYVTQVSQRAACAILHRLEQRLAVWLLMTMDRLKADTIEITQERIAQRLSVRRAGVTVLAGALQDSGAIRYTRGRLSIVDRQKLETVACECYGALAVGRRQTVYI